MRSTAEAKSRSIEIDDGYRQVIAVVEFVLRQQAALQAIYQRKDFCIRHFCLQRKTPTGQCQRALFVFLFRLSQLQHQVKEVTSSVGCEKLLRKTTFYCTLFFASENQHIY